MTDTSIHTIATPLVLTGGETIETRIMFSYHPATQEPPEAEDVRFIEAFAFDEGADADDVTETACEWLHGVGKDTACNFAKQRRTAANGVAKKRRRR
jgi:hypothetical protein